MGYQRRVHGHPAGNVDERVAAGDEIVGEAEAVGEEITRKPQADDVSSIDAGEHRHIRDSDGHAGLKR